MFLLQTLWCTAPLVHPESTLGDAWSRLKYIARGLVTPGLTSEWLHLLASPEFQSLTQRHPYTFSKLQRPCLHRRLSARGRLVMLKNHYEFINKRLGSNLVQDILEPAGCLLAALPLPQPDRFFLRLFYPLHSKEGELSLGLYDKSLERFLFTVSFCACRSMPGMPFELFVGGLQGAKIQNQRELVIHLTRSLHGLRPKALLVFALQQLAQTWGITRIRAVGGREHIYCHYRKRKTFHANYDEFWLECLGERLPDGNFDLPVIAPHRNMADLPRAKRPMYRRRYVMLEEITMEIAARLGRPSTDQVTAPTTSAAAVPTKAAFLAA